MITGRIVFSSRLPWAAANAIVVSLPSTWAQTISMASHWVGLTLPGMIELPGSFSGRISSPSPARGPEPSQRMSLAIFASGTASPRSPAEAAATASAPPSAANLFAAVTNGYPVAAAIRAATSTANPGGALSPVPTAVPPAASSYKPAQDRSSPSRACVELTRRSRTTPAPRSAAPRPAGGCARSSPRPATARP